MFFSEDYEENTPEEMARILAGKLKTAQLKAMVVTMGGEGAVYATCTGESGVTPPQKVNVIDTTGCGDTYMAAYISQRLKSKSIRESGDFASRIASEKIKKMGHY